LTAASHDLPEAPARIAFASSQCWVDAAVPADFDSQQLAPPAVTVDPLTPAANAAVFNTGDAPGATTALLIMDLWTLPAVVALAPSFAQQPAAAVFVDAAVACGSLVVVAAADFVALSQAYVSPAPTIAAAKPNAVIVPSSIIFRVISNAS
jgi:hypothetical protein